MVYAGEVKRPRKFTSSTGSEKTAVLKRSVPWQNTNHCAGDGRADGNFSSTGVSRESRVCTGLPPDEPTSRKATPVALAVLHAVGVVVSSQAVVALRFKSFFADRPGHQMHESAAPARRGQLASNRNNQGWFAAFKSPSRVTHADANPKRVFGNPHASVFTVISLPECGARLENPGGRRR